MNAVFQYFNDACKRFGDGWNRFWFTPIDPLPLAVLRIGVGAIAFYLIALFSFDLIQFFGPGGILPTEAIKAIYPAAWRFSYLDSAGPPDVATLQALHYLGLAILAAYTVGLWTRFTSILSLIVFLAYFHRAPMLTSVGEPVIAMLMFYLCFGPAGARLSVDALLRRRRQAKTPAQPVASRSALGERSFAAGIVVRLIQTHLALIYFLMFCATMQDNIIWWNGTAVWWLIARPESALLDLRWLSNYPYVINLWTTTIVTFYLLFAVLIWNRTARPLLVVLSAPFWLGIALISGVVPFCWAMFVGGLAFVSAEQWLSLCGCSASAARSASGPAPAKGA
ncbi:MAG: hypothetical protein K8U03_24545 [Planctomycetia bacterium]|nr:hypothetical protein [Planctomycetia bacterium]